MGASRAATWRESENASTFRPRSGAKSVCGLRAWRLDLELAGDQRLERLVALGLVVLHRRPAKAGRSAPHTPHGLNSPLAGALVLVVIVVSP